MSEYQYYEFQAIDRPLSPAQVQILRRSSTRATITPTRFVNSYDWGDSSGNPAAWMERYFDAFLHVTNWGTRQLMLRVPSKSLDLENAAAAARGKYLDGLAKTEPAVWRRIEGLVTTLKPADYDEAIRLLADLRTLAGRAERWQRKMEVLRVKHGRKQSFMKRLDRAGMVGRAANA